jgi:thiosulfate dehydrogenase [quinone] large subunit
MRSISDEALAYALLRLALGVNFFGHGFVRIVGGVGNFAAGLVKGFEKTLLPTALVQPFALALPWAEALLGVLLILGLWSRPVLVGGSLLMMALTFGSSMQSNWDAVGSQLVYSVVFALLVFGLRFNTLSLDSLWAARPTGNQSPPH